VVNTDLGSVTFDSAPALAMEIRTAGPFVEGAKPPSEEKNARAMISPDFLGIGLDQFCLISLKLKDQFAAKAKAEGAVPAASQKPVLSESELRSFAGCLPATSPGSNSRCWPLVIGHFA